MDNIYKPTIRYSPNGVVHIEVGVGAVVNVIDHPGFNYGQMVWTSTVLEYDEETGIFETLNTIYVPAKVEAQ